MEAYSREEAAGRAGVSVDHLDRLVELSIVKPDEHRGFSSGQIKRAQLAHSLETAGIPLEGLAAGLERGEVSLDFLEGEQYERFAALSNLTFEELSHRTGVPFELLAVMFRSSRRRSASASGPSPSSASCG